ncbi:MAG: hypothetical protein AB8B83_04100 [Bdellovibrionales bacterium]
MSDLLAEVDEAMRQERLSKFWHDNKAFIIAFILLTILGTGATSTYRSWDQNVKTTQTSELITLQEASDYPSNMLEAELDFRPSIRGIALLSAASTAMQRDNMQDAQTLYARAVKDKGIPSQFRDLAIIMDTRFKMDDETIEASALLAALDPILKGNSAWKPHAQIDAALLNADINPEKSLELLNAVSDKANLPDTLYERAQKLHHVISGNKSANKTDETSDNVQTN